MYDCVFFSFLLTRIEYFLYFFVFVLFAFVFCWYFPFSFFFLSPMLVGQMSDDLWAPTACVYSCRPDPTVIGVDSTKTLPHL